jgi:hypothetical protein
MFMDTEPVCVCRNERCEHPPGQCPNPPAEPVTPRYEVGTGLPMTGSSLGWCDECRAIQLDSEKSS